MSIQAVVFDIGNVLIEWNPERFYDSRIGPARRRALMTQVDLHTMNHEVDRGADLAGSVAALAKQHPDWASEILWWHHDWLDMARPAIDHSVRLLRALRARNVPTFALSNFGITNFQIAESEYPFLQEFNQRWISGHIGVIKPDPAIYAALESDCGIPPENLLFTDDRPENIDAARIRGWRTHLFDGAPSLSQCLVDHGLLTQSEAQ